MVTQLQCNAKTQQVRYLVLDLSNHCTWSFPEFVPFCRNLYDFSSWKKYS
jgi:hypothetical protein